MRLFLARTLDKAWLRVRSLVFRAKVDEQLDAELAFHLEQQIQENLDAGMGRDEAEQAARRTIGGIAQIKDQCRDTRRVNWITDLVGDVRFAVRNLVHAPAFAATIIGTLALGIGANTAIFSIADALLLRTLPLPQPERLVHLLQPDGPGLEQYGERFSFDDFRSMAGAAGPFAQLVAGTGVSRTSMFVDGAEEVVRRDAVSGNYFSVLGIDAAIGRTDFAEQAVISYAFWKRRFNLDSHVLGRAIRIGAKTFEIVGVTRSGFYGLEADSLTDIWTPIEKEPRTHWPLRVIGRLNPGATEAQLLGPLQALFHQRMLVMIEHPPPGTPASLIERVKRLTLKVRSANKGFSVLRVEYGDPLRIVFAIAALVLLIACLNVASLLMARAAARQREMAVRVSLGAGRSRLLRQLLTESLLLSGPAALLGVALAYWLAPLMVKLLAASEAPVELALAIDGHLLAFAVAVCGVATVIFGLAPAWRTAKVDVNAALKIGGSRVRGSRVRAGKSIVALQVAISLVLLVGATLFMRTLRYLSTFDIGFERRNVTLCALQFRGNERGERLHQAWEECLRRVARIAGVESASLSSGSVFNGEHGVGAIRFPDVPVRANDLAGCLLFQTSANFFRTIGTPMLSGRDFELRDFEPAAAPTAIVSDTFARTFFGDGNPIGKRFSNFEDDPPKWITIIGVVTDTRHGTLRTPTRPIAFLPYTWERPERQLTITLRTSMPTGVLGPALRTAVTQDFTIGQISTQETLIDDSLVRERLLATTSSFFAVLALIMAAIGLYGLINYSVTQRTPEIGIRLATGAAPRDVVRMILRDSLLTIAGGVVGELLLSAAVVRWIESLLFGVHGSDPMIFVSAVLILAMTAIFAAWLPARRAARTDPMAALRCE